MVQDGFEKQYDEKMRALQRNILLKKSEVSLHFQSQAKTSGNESRSAKHENTHNAERLIWAFNVCHVANVLSKYKVICNT
jgi:hypothetical protein